MSGNNDWWTRRYVLKMARTVERAGEGKAVGVDPTVITARNATLGQFRFIL